MKPILVLTDFSANALNAAQYAADVALSINGFLVILHVCQPPLAVSELPIPIDTSTLLNDAKREMFNLEKHLTRYCSGKAMIDTEVRAGGFLEEVTKQCKNIQPYTVIMGNQGKTGAERVLFGSHTVYTMKHLMWPVISIPTGVRFSSIRKIALACEFDEVVTTTPVDELTTLVHDFSAELHVLNTGKANAFEPEVILQSGLMQEMLHSLNPIYHLITHDNVDTGVIEFAEKNNIDLLIVLPKRHSLIERLTHTSFTKRMIMHSHMPVMSLHN